MPEELNPYQSPQTEVLPVSGAASGHFLTESMLVNLKGASPWIRFIGIMGFITSGLCVVGGLIFMISFGAAAGFISEELESTGWSSIMGVGALGAAGGIIYIALGLVYFFPARFAYNFGAKLRNYALSNHSDDLDAAFRNNRSLWKFLGIFTIISLALIPAIIFISVIAAIGIAASSMG